MLSLLTPDNLPEVLIGVGAVITAVGGLTLRRIWQNPAPKQGTPDALAVSLADNTRATTAMVGQFGQNLQMFETVNETTEEVLKEARETRQLMVQAVGHLAAIRDAANRRG